MPTPNTIMVKGPWERVEGIANAAFTPGHLCRIRTDGKYEKHGTAGGNTEALFAIEDDHQGGKYTTAYTAGDIAQLAIAGRGAVVYALLKDGENVTVGTFLESGGDGTLVAMTSDTSVGLVKTNSAVAVALEAVDMSGSAGADPSGRILVRVL